MTGKDKLWSGYYHYYSTQAKQKKVNTVDILDEQWNSGENRAQRSVLPWLSGDSVVLEIACGPGRISRFVAPACGTLYCADILPEALAELKRTMFGFKNVITKQINGYDLSCFPADFFDLVYSFTTFFHFDFELVVQYFAEIQRVLKPGGVCVLEFKKMTKNEDLEQLLQKIQNQGGIVKYEAQLDKWRYVSKDMLALLCNYHHFTVLNDDVTDYSFRKMKNAPG